MKSRITVPVFDSGRLDAQKLPMNQKTFSVKPKEIFRQFRRDIFYVVKHTITAHYRARMFSHLFGVDHRTISKILGGPNNYLLFA
jgi:hypothetical protein